MLNQTIDSVDETSSSEGNSAWTVSLLLADVPSGEAGTAETAAASTQMTAPQTPSPAANSGGSTTVAPLQATVTAADTSATTATPAAAPVANAAAVIAPVAAPMSLQAAIASVAVTLVNAAAVVQNPDESTSVFGSQGNAVENINPMSGVTVFAEPQTSGSAASVPVWYAPANTPQYFQNILNNPQLFEMIPGGIAVFKMYEGMAAFPAATLRAFFAWLSQNNIKLGIEAGALVASPGQPGYGVEGFSAPGDLLSVLTTIQAAGGTVSYVAWDEPLSCGSITSGIYTVSQLATQVALAATVVKSVFPNAVIGDIEPIGSSATDSAVLQAWFTAYAQAAGTPFSFFQADMATWNPGWQTELAGAITTAHANNMSIGVVIDGLGAAADTDDSWATQALANAQLILSTPALRPDYVVVQSWQTDPSEAGSATTEGTLASVAADVADSEPADLAIPATAQYNTAGFLQSVTWTGGWTAIQNGTTLQLLSPTGSVVYQTAWSNVQNFSFDPNTASASLTTLVLTSAAGAVPTWQSQSYSLVLGSSGVLLTTPVTSGSTLTLALEASQTGFPGSGITSQATPTVTGTATPGAVVALQVDGVSIGTATAGSSGAWSYSLVTALSNGAHVVEAAVTNSTTGVMTQQDMVVTVDTTPPLQPTLTLAPGSDSGYPDDDITDVTQPVFTGVADPHSQIKLTIDGAVVATVETNLNGVWSYDLNTALSLGTHSVTATEIDAAGATSTQATMQLVIDTAAAEAAVVNYDPLFDTAWYLEQYPQAAAAGGNPYTQYMTTGWKEGYNPSPFFSTSYYLSTNPDVAAAGLNPLTHFEGYGWLEGRNPTANESIAALAQSFPGNQDPLIGYIASLQYSDAICTAVANSSLTVALLHATGSGGVTNNPTLAITADPGATVTIAVGTATPTSFTLGSTGSWSDGYAAASLADGAYTVTVTETLAGIPASSATLSFTLDRTPPAVTALGTSTTGLVQLGVGKVETITLTMSEVVQVTGQPTLTLNDGGVAQYLSGSGSKTLTFSYTVAAGQNTTGLAVTAVNLPGGASVVDSVGNAANFAGALITLPGPVSVETNLTGTGSNITLAGGMQVTATQSINGYSVTLDGTAAASAATVDASSATFGSTFTLAVTGTGSVAQYGSLAAVGSTVNDGLMVTQAGTTGGAATLAIAISNSAGTNAVAGVFDNAGTVDAGAGSTIDITGTSSASLINTGYLISNGMMFLGTAVTGTGVIAIGNGPGASGSLEAQAGVSAGQSIFFDAGTLTIDHLSSFLAPLANYNAKDTIVLTGVDVTTVTWSFNTLLLNGGSIGTLHLQPANGAGLASGSFLLGHSGGNTIITLGTAA
jgi:hypothetical protein